LESNGLKENSMSEIIEGMVSLQKLTKFVCSNNEMLASSINFMQKIIEKPIPFHLEELRLNNCKMARQLTEELLLTISDEAPIKKLGIVNCNLHSHSIPNVQYLVENSTYLVELDISWNDLNKASMVMLTESLAGNRKL
jgi:Ran GTPase-activating protein (RanGAP) involved in mRNA processing and transport